MISTKISVNSRRIGESAFHGSDEAFPLGLEELVDGAEGLYRGGDWRGLRGELGREGSSIDLRDMLGRFTVYCPVAIAKPMEIALWFVPIAICYLWCTELAQPKLDLGSCLYGFWRQPYRATSVG